MKRTREDEELRGRPAFRSCSVTLQGARHNYSITSKVRAWAEGTREWVWVHCTAGRSAPPFTQSASRRAHMIMRACACVRVTLELCDFPCGVCV